MDPLQTHFDQVVEAAKKLFPFRTLSGKKKFSTVPLPVYAPLSDHKAKELKKRRAKNKVARHSRQINRRTTK